MSSKNGKFMQTNICNLGKPPAGKRKSDDPCRWVIAFLVPCGTGRVNDKKVNEENSKVKTKARVEPKLLLQR